MKETERLRHLVRHRIFDLDPLPGFDRLAELTRRIFSVPMTAVTLIGEDRQIFKARCGFDLEESDRKSAFCARTIESDDVFVVRDAVAHPDFCDSALVRSEPKVRFYAGAPIVVSPGVRLGALCLMDTSPREFLPGDRDILQMLAEEVAAQLRGHRRHLHLGREIQARRRQQRALVDHQRRIAQNERMFRQMAHLAKVGAWTYQPDTESLFWSDELFRIAEMEGATMPPPAEAFVAADDRERFTSALQRSCDSGDPMEVEVRINTGKGNLRWVRVTAEAARNESGQRMLLGATQDVTSQRRAETELNRLATLDGLTQLPNRYVFRRTVEHAAAQPSAEGLDALLLLDLDDFKDINDTLGHDAGDWLLNRMSRRLRYCVGSADVIGRLGGDEFGMLLKGRASLADVTATAHLVLEAATAPIAYRGHGLRVGASVGIALLGRDAGDAESLLKAADIALYAAKRGGGDRFAFYSAEIGENVERRHRMFQEVRSGLDRGEFTVAYQPIIHLRSGKVRGFEALVRWNHPEAGFLSAGEFVDALDDVALGRLLSNVVTEQAVGQLALWRADGTPVACVGLNVSVGQIRDPGFADDLLRTLQARNIPSECLVLEITEGVLLGRGAENIMRRVKMLHEAGIRIALDDFGTGYASLSHLRDMPVDTVKIDPSFVQAMLTQPQDRTIVRSVIDMAHGLGKVVVAEGVETREADALLNLMACEFGQGFHYGRPMPAEEVPAFLRSWSEAQLLRTG